MDAVEYFFHPVEKNVTKSLEFRPVDAVNCLPVDQERKQINNSCVGNLLQIHVCYGR